MKYGKASSEDEVFFVGALVFEWSRILAMQKMMNGTQEKLFWPEVVKVVAIFLVVLLHVSARYLYHWPTDDLLSWMIANIFDSLSRISVPLFVMVSGAMLLGRSEDYVLFFRKRFWRVVVPWLGWTLVYMAWQVGFHHYVIGDFHQLKRLGVETFLGGFWFLVMLVELYAVTPFLRIFVQVAKPKDFVYFVSLWLVVVLVWGTHLPLVIQYVGFFILGYGLQNISFKVKPSLIVFVISTLATIVGTFWLSTIQHQFSDILYNFISLPVILASVASFILLKQVALQLGKQVTNQQKNWIFELGKASFGIYLVHVIVLEILESLFQQLHIVLNSWYLFVTLPVLTVLTFLLSFALIWLIQHLPGLKYFA